MTEISYKLFPMRRDSWRSSGDVRKYNESIDELCEKARKKFEVPKWDRTVEYVNGFAKDGWAQYPKITLNAWKAHLRIENELELELFPALFTYSFPYKDAGTVGWWMYDADNILWGSACKIRHILKKSNELFTSDFNNIDCQPKSASSV